MFWTTLRRSVAQLILSLFLALWLLTALQGWFLGEPEITRCFLLMGACYALAFLGLGGEWFWARWFAMGLGNWGAVSLLAVFQVGPNPIILIFGGLHLVVTLLLWGPSMAGRYELSEAWRQRWNLQDESVDRLRNVVVSAGMTLPFLILAAFGPREEGLGFTVLAWAPLAVGALALAGLARMRTWGVLALGATSALALVAAAAVVLPVADGGCAASVSFFPGTLGSLGTAWANALPAAPVFAAVIAGLGFLTLVPAMARFLAKQR